MTNWLYSLHSYMPDKITLYAWREAQINMRSRPTGGEILSGMYS